MKPIFVQWVRLFSCRVNQGGPTLFFPRAKGSFPLDPRTKKSILAQIFKNNSQFLLLLRALVKK
jgi:hypothetical protein